MQFGDRGDRTASGMRHDSLKENLVKYINRIIRSTILALLVLNTSSAGATDLTILASSAFTKILQALIPIYERETGNRVVLNTDMPVGVLRRVDAGEPFDLVIAPDFAMLELTHEKPLIGTAMPLAKVGLGVAVPAGKPEPDIKNVAALKQALLSARAIAFADPNLGGASGFYVVRLLQRLGIAEEMRWRSVMVPSGPVSVRLLDGSADLAIQQISEILAVKGVTLVGPLPDPLQFYISYSGAVSSTPTANQAMARDFLTRLGSPVGQKIVEQQGMTALR
jgi:molybdate transport system substrate-binding protein